MRTHRYGGAAQVLAEAQAEQLRLECCTEVPSLPNPMRRAARALGLTEVQRNREILAAAAKD